MKCPDLETIAELARGQLTGGHLDEIEGHLGDCATCRRLVATLVAVMTSSNPAAATVDAPTAPAGPRTGDRIGRYELLRLIGVGAMGLVYQARDVDLERDVALKLLLPAETAERTREAALAEAQAMAQLRHANVVQVFDVGNHGPQMFVAMELVHGSTMRRWLGAPHTWREAVDVMIAAGRGLAAAHRQGIVHRDFKPENVLIGDDGRVVVSDFGLARPVGGISEASGTPAYMAPEARSRGMSDPRVDQYSFCVALHEALHGARPPAWDPTRRIPRWLARVCAGGLARKPSDRYPSMDALVAELERGQARAVDTRRRRRYAIALAAAVATGVAATIALWPGREAACTTGDERVTAVWSPATRARLEQAFAASQRPHAAATLARLVAIVDDWSRAWTAGYVDACEATRVRGDQSEHVLDLRVHCLTRRLEDAASRLELLAAGGDDAIDHALDAVDHLPALGACADTAGLLAAVALPDGEAARAAVAATRRELATARTQGKLGRYTTALGTATTALTAARATSYAPVIAEALTVVGQLQGELADRASRTTLAEAMRTAAAAGHTTALLEAATVRTIELVDRSHFELAEEVGAQAEATARHAHPPPEIAVALDDALGLLHAERGRVKEAEAHYRKALEVAQRELGPDSLAAQRALEGLGTLYRQKGRFVEARASLEQVLASRRRILGEGHPDVAGALDNVGNVYRVEGRLREAREHYERALAIRTTALGLGHPSVGKSLNNLGILFAESGDSAKAESHFERALALWRDTLGRDHVEVAGALGNLGLARNARGDHAGARAPLERALGLLEGVHGPDHPAVATMLSNLGVVATDEERYDDALALYRRAQKIAEAAYGPAHPDVADYLANLTSVHKRMGKLREAAEMTPHTLEVIAKAYGADHVRVGQALINFGNLQMVLREPAGALEAYTKALAICEAKLGRRHPFVGHATHGIAGALFDLRRPAEALPFEERAIEIWVAARQPAELIAGARFGLAKARGAAGRAEARAALVVFEQAKDASRVAEIRAWLAAHP